MLLYIQLLQQYAVAAEPSHDANITVFHVNPKHLGQSESVEFVVKPLPRLCPYVYVVAAELNHPTIIFNAEPHLFPSDVRSI